MKENKKEKLIPMVVRISKDRKKAIEEMAKKDGKTESDIIRAGIEKEINLQIYRDNLDIILNQISTLIDIKLDKFIKSERKLIANNVRINAMNTYMFGEIMKQLMGDELYENFKSILESARQKANYFVTKDSNVITKEELYEFYNIKKNIEMNN